MTPARVLAASLWYEAAVQLKAVASHPLLRSAPAEPTEGLRCPGWVGARPRAAAAARPARLTRPLLPLPQAALATHVPRRGNLCLGIGFCSRSLTPFQGISGTDTQPIIYSVCLGRHRGLTQVKHMELKLAAFHGNQLLTPPQFSHRNAIYHHFPSAPSPLSVLLEFPHLQLHNERAELLT